MIGRIRLLAAAATGAVATIYATLHSEPVEPRAKRGNSLQLPGRQQQVQTAQKK